MAFLQNKPNEQRSAVWKTRLLRFILYLAVGFAAAFLYHWMKNR